jgi:hypothetical protein
VALLLATGAWLIGQQLLSSSPSAHAPKATKPSDLVAFQDPAGTLAGSYPSSWHRLLSPDPQVVVIAASNDGASFQVRKTPLDAQVSAANLGAVKKLTDQVVRSGKRVTYLRQPQRVTLAGLPGYLYLYTFDDTSTGQRGAHAHYFLVQGTTMVTLVFQALPADRMLSLAPLFDRIAATFRAAPA